MVGVFSGPSANTGRAERNSLQVEADQLNSRGGVLGSRIEVVAADSELNPNKAAALVKQELADDDVKLLVGPNFTAGYLAVRGVITQAGMPNCVTTVADDAMTGATFTFRADIGQRSSISALLAYLHQYQPDVKKVGLLDDGEETALSYDRQLAEQAGHYGVTYLGHGTAADPDPTSAVQKVLAAGAQAVILSAQPAPAARIAQAVQQSAGGARPMILGFHALSGYEFPSVAGDVALNSVFVNTNDAYLTGTPDSSWPTGYRAFVQSLTHQYGYAVNGVDLNGSPAVADCLLQWSRAVARAGGFRAADVVKAWESLALDQSETVIGVPERLSAANHDAVSPSSVLIYEWAKVGGKFRLRQLNTPPAG